MADTEDGIAELAKWAEQLCAQLGITPSGHDQQDMMEVEAAIDAMLKAPKAE